MPACPVAIRKPTSNVSLGDWLREVDQSEMKDDLVQDMIAVLTSFCARLYGRRAAKNRAAKAVAAAASPTEDDAA